MGIKNFFFQILFYECVSFVIKKKRYYLRPVVGRPNLHVLTNAHVTRVLMDVSGKRATGIELVDKFKVKRKYMVNKEVILTAGAIGSPQLLLLSGIGPNEDLKKLDIPVIKDLPVGKNLRNHVTVSIKVHNIYIVDN